MLAIALCGILKSILPVYATWALPQLTTRVFSETL